MYVSVCNCFTFDCCVCKLDFGDGWLGMLKIVGVRRAWCVLYAGVMH